MGKYSTVIDLIVLYLSIYLAYLQVHRSTLIRPRNRDPIIDKIRKPTALAIYKVYILSIGNRTNVIRRIYIRFCIFRIGGRLATGK